MDETERKLLLSTYCLFCGVRSGWCLTDRDEPIRDIRRQHKDRYEAAADHVEGRREGEVRAMLAKSRLI
jgi:hypothetical protein